MKHFFFHFGIVRSTYVRNKRIVQPAVVMTIIVVVQPGNKRICVTQDGGICLVNVLAELVVKTAFQVQYAHPASNQKVCLSYIHVKYKYVSLAC
jgi:hypothetical protein